MKFWRAVILFVLCLWCREEGVSGRPTISSSPALDTNTTGVSDTEIFNDTQDTQHSLDFVYDVEDDHSDSDATSNRSSPDSHKSNSSSVIDTDRNQTNNVNSLQDSTQRDTENVGEYVMQENWKKTDNLAVVKRNGDQNPTGSTHEETHTVAPVHNILSGEAQGNVGDSNSLTGVSDLESSSSDSDQGFLGVRPADEGESTANEVHDNAPTLPSVGQDSMEAAGNTDNGIPDDDNNYDRVDEPIINQFQPALDGDQGLVPDPEHTARGFLRPGETLSNDGGGLSNDVPTDELVPDETQQAIGGSTDNLNHPIEIGARPLGEPVTNWFPQHGHSNNSNGADLRGPSADNQFMQSDNSENENSTGDNDNNVSGDQIISENQRNSSSQALDEPVLHGEKIPMLVPDDEISVDNPKTNRPSTENSENGLNHTNVENAIGQNDSEITSIFEINPTQTTRDTETSTTLIWNSIEFIQSSTVFFLSTSEVETESSLVTDSWLTVQSSERPVPSVDAILSSTFVEHTVSHETLVTDDNTATFLTNVHVSDTVLESITSSDFIIQATSTMTVSTLSVYHPDHLTITTEQTASLTSTTKPNETITDDTDNKEDMQTQVAVISQSSVVTTEEVFPFSGSQPTSTPTNSQAMTLTLNETAQPSVTSTSPTSAAMSTPTPSSQSLSSTVTLTNALSSAITMSGPVTWISAAVHHSDSTTSGRHTAASIVNAGGVIPANTTATTHTSLSTTEITTSQGTFISSPLTTSTTSVTTTTPTATIPSTTSTHQTDTTGHEIKQYLTSNATPTDQDGRNHEGHLQPPVTDTAGLVTDNNAIAFPPGLTIKPETPRRPVESPSSFVELKFGMSWPDFCDHEVSIRGELVEILQVQGGHAEITADQIQVMNEEQRDCYHLTLQETEEILVYMYLVNKSHHYDRGLTLVCAQILESRLDLGDTSIIRNKLIGVRFRDEYYLQPATGASTNVEEQAKNGQQADSNPLSDPGITIALVLAVVGGCCCVGLLVIQIIIRRRNRNSFVPNLNRSISFTSADSIQLSSVTKSRPNSGLFNPGLDLTDPMDPTHPLNFMQLSDFCADDKQIAAEYQKVPNRMPRLSVVPVGDEDKNRYANILPLAQTRVKLLQDGAEPRSSYINASYVTGPNNQCQYYIATQAPTAETVSDFWTMVWQQNSKAVVMLTQMEEDGQSKCAAYWPELVGKSAAQRHGDFLIELKRKDVHQEYIASKLEINNLRKIETRQIDHFWYTCWPSNGMPEPISLIKLVLDTRPKYESSGTPLIVHCSPGTGRTCTFIGLDLCMRQFEERRIVDVMKTVYVMRQERAGAIQNKEQYALLYHALNEYATIVISPAVSAASSATTLHALLPS